MFLGDKPYKRVVKDDELTIWILEQLRTAKGKATLHSLLRTRVKDAYNTVNQERSMLSKRIAKLARQDRLQKVATEHGVCLVARRRS